jgi:hypothetical protein
MRGLTALARAFRTRAIPIIIVGSYLLPREVYLQMQLRLVPLNISGDLQNFIYIQTVEGKEPVINDGWSKMDNPRAGMSIGRAFRAALN